MTAKIKNLYWLETGSRTWYFQIKHLGYLFVIKLLFKVMFQVKPKMPLIFAKLLCELNFIVVLDQNIIRECKLRIPKFNDIFLSTILQMCMRFKLVLILTCPLKSIEYLVSDWRWHLSRIVPSRYLEMSKIYKFSYRSPAM